MNANVSTAEPTLQASAPAGTAQGIIESLKKQANDILGAVFSIPLSGFQVGTQGNMRYYWQNPSNLKFSLKTYNWISSGLMANTQPAKLDIPFSNRYIEVFSKIGYSLSKTDQGLLNTAQQNAVNQQMALLNSWKQAYGSIPVATDTQQPIDIIMHTIATTWAQPATNLLAIQNSKNLNVLLNNTPASGKPILNVLANYLNALGSTISLQNSTTMNTGYLAQALAAVQSPSASNGGMSTDASDTIFYPAYQVATSLSDILNGLQDTDNKATLKMSVSRTSTSELTVSVEGSSSFVIPIEDFLEFSIDASANYFSENIALSSNTVSVEMDFTGVTAVSFGPVAFDMATGLNWYWTQPITEAINNGNQDLSGFKFAPNPNTDFSTNGPFGYLQGVAISNYPSISISVTSDSYSSIVKDISQTSRMSLTFLGIPLGISGSSSTYSHQASSDDTSSTVTITLNPPTELVAGSSVDSVGWVLGAQTMYPGA